MVQGLDVVELTPHVQLDVIQQIGESSQKHNVKRFLNTSLHRPHLLRADLRLPIPDSPVISVPAVSANSPVVTTVGGVHAKMRPRQTKQQSNNEETSDAVACQKVKATERTIGTIMKHAIKKTGYVKRNLRS